MRRWTPLPLALLSIAACLPATSARAQDVSGLGQIVPGERVVRLAAPRGAIVGELLVKRGDRVKRGDVVAQLRDAPLARAQLERARRQVDLAKSELALVSAGERAELVEAQRQVLSAQETESKLAEARRERNASLLAKGFVNQDRYDEAASQAASLRARVERERSVLEGLGSGRKEVVAQAKAALAVAEAQAAEAAASLELQRVRAPFDGEVLDILSWPGEGDPNGAPIVSLGETQRMMVEAEVNESDAARVRTGQRARIRGQALKKEIGGEVVEIQRLFQGSRVFPLDPAAYADRRTLIVRIRPDDAAALAGLSQAHVTVTIAAK